MEEKEIYTEEELEQDVKSIKEDMELLKGYNNLLEKIKALIGNKR